MPARVLQQLHVMVLASMLMEAPLPRKVLDVFISTESALACVALSAVKEEPHLALGTVSSDEPLGVSNGLQRPASSAAGSHMDH